jgi:acyl-CoA thioesterase-1
MRHFLCVLALLLPILAKASGVILVFGDSLSAGYGLSADEAWPRLLQAELGKKSKKWLVVNASVSGETTAGGLTRLPEALDRHKPAVVVLELGANDGLRGLPIEEMEQNLAAMIRAAQAKGARVHLIGMKMPPNYGRAYTEKFSAVYSKLAREYKTTLTPFLLAPVILRRSYFQADGIHPIAAAQPLLMEHVLDDLAKSLR